MGKQENRGTRRNKMRMETAMIELLKAKSIEKITVRELIERADVSRYTFYNYYYNVYDLLDSIGNEIIEEIVSECRKLIGKPYQEGQHPIITAMMKIVLAHEDAIQISEEKIQMVSIFAISGCMEFLSYADEENRHYSA